MSHNTTPYDPTSIEYLARIIDRARAGNRVPTNVSRAQLSSDLVCLYQEIFATTEPPEQHETTLWDLAEEEKPMPTRRYKIFAKALAADDPLATLRTWSHDRSLGELYLLQIRIKSRARSKRPSIEKGLSPPIPVIEPPTDFAFLLPPFVVTNSRSVFFSGAFLIVGKADLYQEASTTFLNSLDRLIAKSILWDTTTIRRPGLCPSTNAYQAIDTIIDLSDRGGMLIISRFISPLSTFSM